MNIEAFFHEHPVFLHEEFAAWKTQRKPLKAISINTALQHYVNNGRITRIRRGLFATIPPGQTIDTFNVDPYLMAAKATPDSILGYHTALELHGIAYSVFNQFTFLTQLKSKSFEFQNQWFQASTHPTQLVTNKKISTGTERVNRQGLDIQITNLARTYVDILDRIELSGGWEEVCRGIEKIVVVDIDEIIHYCLSLKNACLAAKVGYFLEKRDNPLKLNKKQLSKLQRAKPKIPQYASKRNHDKFESIKHWNILLPRFVIHRNWEEPDEKV